LLVGTDKRRRHTMEGTRGSDRLESLKKAEISEEELERLVGFAEEEGVDLVDWLIRGIPAVDSVAGSFHVRPGSLGSLIERLIAEGVVRQVVVFPYGIPATELAEVRFSSER
jgi:hypothetical protein